MAFCVGWTRGTFACDNSLLPSNHPKASQFTSSTQFETSSSHQMNKMYAYRSPPRSFGNQSQNNLLPTKTSFRQTKHPTKSSHFLCKKEDISATTTKFPQRRPYYHHHRRREVVSRGPNQSIQIGCWRWKVGCVWRANVHVMSPWILKAGRPGTN
jgi:hypothetical protein